MDVEDQAQSAADSGVPDEDEEFDPIKFLLNRGLYDELHLLGDGDPVRRLLKPIRPLQFDCYCVQCAQDSIFKTPGRSSGGGAGSPPPPPPDWLKNGIWYLDFECQREPKHVYTFILQVDRQALSKIGQSPSVADIAVGDVKRFRTVLDTEDRAEFVRAIGLAAHGVGVGSFVYLRRIFERLINNERDHAREAGEALSNFDQLRFDEKIKALEKWLPPLLVRNRSAYRVLSAGIHQLDEETCLRLFPSLKAAVILILEAHLELKRRRQAEAELEQTLRSSTEAVARL